MNTAPSTHHQPTFTTYARYPKGHLADLASEVISEFWGYPGPRPHLALHAYLTARFDHAHRHQGFTVSSGRAFSTFNTGLTSRRRGGHVYALYQNPYRGNPDWHFHGWKTREEIPPALPALPPPATLLGPPTDYYTGGNLSCSKHLWGILHTPAYQQAVQKHGGIEEMIKHIGRTAGRNPELITPAWDPQQHKPYTLYPFTHSTDKPIEALVISRRNRHSPYTAVTLKTITSAYCDARLTHRLPPHNWLTTAFIKGKGI